MSIRLEGIRLDLLRSDSDTGVVPRSPAAVVLGLFRILMGLSFAIHGLSGLTGHPAGKSGAHAAAFLEWPSWWASVIELFGGLAVMLGLGTRVAALLCSGSMAYAFLTVHAKNGVLPIQNGGEPAAMFCWTFFLIAFTGPGSFTVPGLFARVKAGRTGVTGPAISHKRD